MDPKHALLLDGSNLFMRLYHRKACEQPQEAVPHIRRAIKALVAEHAADLLIVALDPLDGRCFRYDLYPEYKARPHDPEAMTARRLTSHLLPYLTEWGVCLARNDEYEADDGIATLTQRLLATGRARISILSTDRDLWSLTAQPAVTCLVPVKGAETPVGADEVRNILGVSPEQILALKVLAGDASDNLPRVGAWDRSKPPYGITEKRAAALLQQYGTVRGIYQNLAALPEREQSWLVRDRPQLPRFADLIRLRDDVPLNLDPRDANVKNLCL